MHCPLAEASCLGHLEMFAVFIGTSPRELRVQKVILRCFNMTEWQLNKLSHTQRNKLDEIIQEAHGWSSERIESILQDNRELDDDPDGLFTDKQLRVRAVLSSFKQQFRMKPAKRNQQGKRVNILETAGDINEYISQHIDDPLWEPSQISQQQTIPPTENSTQNNEIQNEEIDTSDLLARIVTQAAEIVLTRMQPITKTHTNPQVRPAEFQEQLEIIRAQELVDRETDQDMTRLLVHNLHIEKSNFNPIRYRQRSDFESELGKIHWLKQNVWKTLIIKGQSEGEHSEYCGRLLQTLMAAQCALLSTIHDHLQNKPVGQNLLHILKLVYWATDDAQTIRDSHNLPSSDKHLIQGRVKSSEVLSEETRSQQDEQRNVELAENLTALLKQVGKINTGTTPNPEGNRKFRWMNRQQKKQ
ncbi:MAG: hypothetical protein EZS28_026898 [Streblomastix strix]|uniref:Uncharacterized protein n=1 Tax=Streblomastix strix TaxID=222440 RepID=A0A5J4V3T0_9EUKA|nr:MAG: hypothetical protein EZS28_026898 [Streblomastix strix]